MLSSTEKARQDTRKERKHSDHPARPALGVSLWLVYYSLAAIISRKCCRAEVSPVGDTLSMLDISTGEDLLPEQEASPNPILTLSDP